MAHKVKFQVTVKKTNGRPQMSIQAYSKEKCAKKDLERAKFVPGKDSHIPKTKVDTQNTNEDKTLKGTEAYDYIDDAK